MVPYSSVSNQCNFWYVYKLQVFRGHSHGHRKPDLQCTNLREKVGWEHHPSRRCNYPSGIHHRHTTVHRPTSTGNCCFQHRELQPFVLRPCILLGKYKFKLLAFTAIAISCTTYRFHCDPNRPHSISCHFSIVGYWVKHLASKQAPQYLYKLWAYRFVSMQYRVYYRFSDLYWNSCARLCVQHSNAERDQCNRNCCNQFVFGCYDHQLEPRLCNW